MENPGIVVGQIGGAAADCQHEEGGRGKASSDQQRIETEGLDASDITLDEGIAKMAEASDSLEGLDRQAFDALVKTVQDALALEGLTIQTRRELKLAVWVIEDLDVIVAGLAKVVGVPPTMAAQLQRFFWGYAQAVVECAKDVPNE